MKTTCDTNAFIAGRLLRLSPAAQPFMDRSERPTRYLIDTRGIVADPYARGLLVAAVVERVRGRCDVLAGVSKSGVPWAAMTAERLCLPLAVILEEPRRTGLGRVVEGDVAGRAVIVVDNFTKSGRSLINARDQIARAGGTVVEALALVAAPNAVGLAGVACLFTLADLLGHAVRSGRLTRKEALCILEEESR